MKPLFLILTYTLPLFLLSGCASPLAKVAQSTSVANTAAPKSDTKLTTPQPERFRTFFVLEQGSPIRKEIALTFDDGPHPEFTPRLLALLKQLEVKATFFLVGEMVEESPKTARLIAQSGNEIGNHSYSHRNLNTLSVGQIEQEIAKNNKAIWESCGVQPTFFRPPGGNYNEDVIKTLSEQGMPLALWTFNPKDFANPPASAIEAGILKNLTNGMVVLLHSGVQATYTILPSLVKRLKSEGYRFVTLTEMAQEMDEHRALFERKRRFEANGHRL